MLTTELVVPKSIPITGLVILFYELATIARLANEKSKCEIVLSINLNLII